MSNINIDSIFLRNCWYLAAWSDELTDGELLFRRICGIPLVLYREMESRAPRALHDRCPHRFAPLSRGRLTALGLECGYHGLAFDGSGQCVANPHGAVPRAAKVRAFPLREAYHGVWIWMGDTALADPALLPDLSFISDAPPTAFSKGYLHSSANYLLYVDNIMDLTHTDFLHPSSLGGGAISRAKPKVEERGCTVHVRWESPDELPMPLHVTLGLFSDDERVDRSIEVAWSAPSVLQLVSDSSRRGDHGAPSVSARNIHVMTPETSASLHYFYASTRNFAVDDDVFNKRFHQLRTEVFTTEDAPMIEAQQDRIGDHAFFELHPLLLQSDNAAVRVRRILARMIDDEARHSS